MCFRVFLLAVVIGGVWAFFRLWNYPRSIMPPDLLTILSILLGIIILGAVFLLLVLKGD